MQPYMQSGHTRRQILELALASHSAAIAAAQQHAHQTMSAGTAKLVSLSTEDASEVEALASLIIPSGATPGAREAGVVYFIDKALAAFDRDKRETYRQGLRMARDRRLEMFPQSTGLAALSPADQLRFARAIETTEFFEMLRVHVIIGFLAPPEYGGNRNRAGWALIGFEG
ncbi:MAG: gluconate 2-dehydrogenase subunit 3 family protein [Bryobacterales bacterium]|nr:gluconate 2-dehydrogenase subunit 3 family protein [Bryobacterales bacterium]